MALGKKIILVICLIVFACAAAILLNYIAAGVQEQNAFNDLEGRSYEDLWKQNHDLVGWVMVDDTKIDYPVMQTKDDPEYYLHHNFSKEESRSGTPFLDAKSDINLPTANLLVYGHNMRNGTMFHDLLKYKDKDFYNEHRTFTFVSIYEGGRSEEHTYEVIAAAYSKVYDTDSTKFKYYQYGGITAEKEFNEYVDGINALSAYNTGVSAEYGDKLVTLSTCAYHTKNGRFFIVGKETK